MRLILKALIRGYILTLSPILGGACRFFPSCSQYALECITKYGSMKGALLAGKRVARCNPFHHGGCDPVP